MSHAYHVLSIRLLAAFTLVLLVLMTASHSDAMPFERLVMPGKVIAGHAEYESECARCHKPFSKERQAALCLDCHDLVDADIQNKTGFHGLTRGIGDQECKTCHSDHLGRAADVVQLEVEAFNHDFTDFELKGRHSDLACHRCHAADTKYREAPHRCLSCHERDEPHQGRLGEKCGDCHSEKNWSKTRFDHSETDFPLQEKHEDVVCAGCHANERYKDTPNVCASCHEVDDYHRGRYGDECDTCHTPEAWDKSTFEHNKDTDFKLVKKHQDVACDDCHSGPKLYDQNLETECIGCHKDDDTHKGRYGKKCDDCHTPAGWRKAKFDHDKETNFKLKGAHTELECTSCHKGTIEDEKRDTDCYACHRKDDVHKGQQGKLCDQCHNETGWADKVFFDHDLTTFPLIGLHATTPCEECHIGSEYKDTPDRCSVCHEKDDEHKRALGNQCDLCHNPNAWTLWTFNHDTQTEFVLDGAHEGLACDRCHMRPVKRNDVRVPSACGTCHQPDDIHDGGFGLQCGRCHTTEAFDEIQFRY